MNRRGYCFVAAILPVLTLVFSQMLVLPLQAAAEESIHIAGQQNIGWNWSINDGGGYSWGIGATGACYGGMNSVYSSGMQLTVANQSFNWGNNGIGSSDGREVEVGPWTAGAVKVWRRIYIDAKLGYCRWIDIYENSGGAEQAVSLRYYSSMSCVTRQVNTLSGRADPTDKDWAAITSDPSNASYPAIVHIYAGKNSKVIPKFQYSKNNSSLYYNVSLKVPGGKTVALCFFEAQARQLGEAEKFLKEFNLKRELGKVPKPLLKLLVNMPGPSQTLGNLELPRDDKNDLIVTGADNELMGTILNEKYALKTTFGDIELKAAQVLGLNVPPGEDLVQIALTDGQIVSGKLTNGPIQLKLADGAYISMPLSKLKTAAYRISESRPEDIVPKSPLVVLRSGQQLALSSASQVDCAYETQHGELKLNPSDVRAIYLDTPEGGLHRAAFGNGSVLSGLLVAEDMKLNLALGPTLNVRRYLVKDIVFPGPTLEPNGLSEMTLRNEDDIFGHVADKSVAIESKGGKIDVPTGDISEMEFQQNAYGMVKIKLHNGTTMSGKLVARTIRFKIDPGPEIAVSIGHINQITCPKPEPKPSTRPTTTTAPSVTTPPPDKAKPPESSGSDAALQKTAAEIKELEAELANLQATAAEAERAGKLEQAAEAKKRAADVQARTDELKKKLAEQRAREGAMKEEARAAEAQRTRSAPVRTPATPEPN